MASALHAHHLARFPVTCTFSTRCTRLKKEECPTWSDDFLILTGRSSFPPLSVRKKCPDDSRQVLHRSKNLSSSLGRRHTLFTTFVPLPLFIAQRFQGMEQYEKAVQDIGHFGFDGLGKSSEDYAIAKVLALAQAGEGAVLFLGIDGHEKPLQIIVGAAEAMAVLTAAQERVSPRPVTHEAWGSTLAAVGWKVNRVAVTSLQQDTFYSRIVLSPSGDVSASMQSSASHARSVDVRPSDGIALALRCHAPLFVSKSIAEQIIPNTEKSVPESMPNLLQLRAQWILPPISFIGSNSQTVMRSFVESISLLDPHVELGQ